MTDRITVADLEVYARVGVPDEERRLPQRLLVTVELEKGIAAAAAADDLTLTINYYAVSHRILDLARGGEWRLIETLAVSLATVVLAEFDPESVTVEVKKFILPEARYVSVRVQRSRE